jgi:hypothetical protein
MGQFPNSHLNPPFWYRPAPRPKRRYDLVDLPAQAKRAAAFWVEDVAQMSAAEKHVLVTKMIVGHQRSVARKRGYPEPIFFETIVNSLPGGGNVADHTTTRPLRHSHGGNAENDARALAALAQGARPEVVGVAKAKRVTKRG